MSGMRGQILRALIWKEWREQRTVVLCGVAQAIALPFILMAGTAASSRPLDAAALAGILPGVYLALIWPLTSAAAGAATIANEVGDGTLGYLLSRPVSRARVWLAKVAVGWLSALLILIGSLAVAWLFSAASGMPREWHMDLGRVGEGLDLAAPLIVSATILLFAASVFFSTLLPRALTAAAAGVAFSMLLLSGLIMFWSGLGLTPGLETDWFTLEVLLSAALLLTASLWIFARHDLRRGPGLARRAVLWAGVALGCGGLLTVPLALAHGRIAPGEARLDEPVPTAAGDLVLATALGDEGSRPEVWLVHSDGSGLVRLAGRLSFEPAMSPDRRHVAYISRRGTLGMRSGNGELRAVRLDGGGNHVLATLDYVQPWSMGGRRIAFSPNGQRVACLDGNKLLVADLRGRGAASFDLSSTATGGARLAGWSHAGDEVVLITPPWSARHEGQLVSAVDIVTGRVRPILQSTRLIWLPPAIPPREGWRLLPFMTQGDDPRMRGLQLHLLDVMDGSVERIASSACFGAIDLSDDGDVLAYARCDPPTRRATGVADVLTSEIHRMDLETKLDEPLATIAGWAGSLRLSPSHDRVLVSRWDSGGRALGPLVVGKSGVTTEMGTGWEPVGWQGRERVILVGGTNDGQLAVANASTGDLRRFFP